MKDLTLFYHQPAEDSDYGWENQSLPLGNGYLGANIFGIPQKERIQITENSLQNPGYTEHGMMGGLNNFAEIYLEFGHKDYTDYERGLDLKKAVAYTQYRHMGVLYRREYFTSYPDKVLVIRITADEKDQLSLRLAPQIPFIKNYALKEGDGGGKTGLVTANQTDILLSGKMLYYDILFAGCLQIHSTDGQVTAQSESLTITGANEAILIFAAATNYILDSNVFTETDPKKKLRPQDPLPRVRQIIAEAAHKDFQTLMQRHLADYTSLFGKVGLRLGPTIPQLPTDELIAAFQAGQHSGYLASLYFQYGRYLLICSSRKGCLPCNLQGIWNCHDLAPWGSGYWHNINVQMNYWPVFSTNLAELFPAYVDFFQAFLPQAMHLASAYIAKNLPEKFIPSQGACGWTIGTASYPYSISSPGTHSGPGTGGLTSKLFWEYYAFTQDETVLKEISYPVLEGMSKFLTKTVKEYEGRYLTFLSASPEQMLGGPYTAGGKYYHTVGCAFDQQMIYENGRDFLEAARLLGIDNAAVAEQKKQINHYDPVQIGWSGQIKEYEEENFYGEIGEYHHRHISHLMALYPGNLINSQTDAWLEAARVSLNERGDQSTGWALAHRLNAWARIGDGNRAYQLLFELLSKRTLENLWDTHPPYQIDGNLGGTAGICEMLLQSHEGRIDILPALPDAWPDGSYQGLVARGAFEVSVTWSRGKAMSVQIHSRRGNKAVLAYPGIATVGVKDQNGCLIEVDSSAADSISFATIAGSTYTITGFCKKEHPPRPSGLNLTVSDQVRLEWQGEKGLYYNVYRALGNAPAFCLISQEQEDSFFLDDLAEIAQSDIVTYKVTAFQNEIEGPGLVRTLHRASELQLDRYKRLIEAKT